MKTCKVENCGKNARAKGYCYTHYKQVKRTGRVISLGLSRSRPNEVEFVGPDCFIKLYDRRGNVNGTAVIDAEDYDKVKGFRWSINGWGYARTSKPCIMMHRLILGEDRENIEIDHKDRDRLNNRKSNLRTATVSQNQHNTGLTKRNTSGYKAKSRAKNAMREAEEALDACGVGVAQ